MQYQDYQKSRDAAWQILIDMKITKLPVSLANIFHHLNIPIYPYYDNEKYLREMGLWSLVHHTDGFAMRTCKRIKVFYDDKLPHKRIRFTLAHELGHIVSGHLDKEVVTKRNSEPSIYDNDLEQAANVFASRLLAPSFILHELRTFSVYEIANLCDISQQSARYRLNRLEKLEERNQELICERGYGCYYISPLEQQLRVQFDEFIQSHKV